MGGLDLDARAALLRQAIGEAGAFTHARFQDPERRRSQFKGPQDYLTETDGAVEQMLRARLLGAFAADGFLGEEEGGRAAGAEGGIWVVDPIDGTANFARGIPHFCVSVAFVLDGVTELGAILAPATDELFFARRGQGASLNGQPMRVMTTQRIDEATVELGWSKRTSDRAYLDLVGRTLAAGAAFRRAGSGALGIAYVAAGRQEAYAELHINSWDCLAGLVMVTEAGGLVNDFLAGDGLARGNPVLATAPGTARAVAGLTGIPLTNVTVP